MRKIGVLMIALIVLITPIMMGCEPEEDVPPENDANKEDYAGVNEDEEEQNNEDEALPPERKGVYPDGTYRGAFHDRGTYLGDQIGIQQVGVQFTLEDNEMQDLEFRVLAWGGDNYMVPDDPNNEWPKEDLDVLREQYEEALEYLEGRHITDITDLFEPGDVAEDKEGTGEILDTWTAATMRANKITHAIRDALNKGVYVPED
ncbi:hypothetical protein [Natranaerobius thermophilus]|uniref:FMN-binding domain-containing protein n=1 Tax=Natranaerobius thermophilus (strain ATCC BAA-1301 / DSM 18059 / JW/NM-WN-LF) TaxID=457570 RepID=B2A4L1_NATTJ|nr:hypothetical protein [Natranaerobius thermophilus]ACB85186.1 hypothetical protein Nther_1612 [Natranaerobius thermophilus JW/NM-WN-LF]